jgi:DNA replication and repair protein RecF
MTYLAKSGAQVLVTTTDPNLVRPAASPSTLWCQVNAGAVTCEQEFISNFQ